MAMQSMKIIARLGIALIVIVGWCGAAHAQWTALTNAFPGHPERCLLLTDGTAMCQEWRTNHWHRLTPDINGSYINGTWSNLADMPNGTDTSGGCAPCTYAPLFYASAVLADGRVVVIGGEFNTNGQTRTNIGFLYDPSTDSWSAQLTEPFGTGNIGDAQSVILQNGTMLLANLSNGNIASFNPSTLTFTALNPAGKLAGDTNNEEGWTILPDGRVLTVDAFINNSFEIYDPTTNTWGSPAPGTTAGVNLADVGGNCNSAEVGPGVSRPNGTIIYFTGNSAGQNAVYDISTQTWTAGPSFPNTNEAVADGPASLLPNGNVLVQASPACVQTSPGPPPTFSVFNTPSHFYEFDGTNLNAVTDAPNASSLKSFHGHMLVLPSGEVLFTAFSQPPSSIDVVQIYSNGGAPQDAWRPVITAAPISVNPGSSYSISGKQFNGFSEGGSYGDNAQMSTNYPLVRITNRATGHVFYARTHDHSSMGVQAVGSTKVVTTQVDAPSNSEVGQLSDLEVVVNGIPSKKFVINGPGLTVPGPLSLSTCQGSSTTTTLNVCNTGKLDLAINSITPSDPQFSVSKPSSGYPVNISPDFCFPFQVQFTPSGTGTTNASLTISSNDPNSPSTTVQVTGSVPPAVIDTLIANFGGFGNVCKGSFSDLPLTINNNGGCNLLVNSISSSSTEFKTAGVLSFPLAVEPAGSLQVPIRLQPTSFGVKSSTITVSSNAANPSVNVSVSGNTPPGNIKVTGSGAFGDVCAGTLSEKTIQVCDFPTVGACSLNVMSAAFSPACSDFTLVNNPFPAIVSDNSCLNLTVRFTPTSAGVKSCNLVITSDDPTASSVTIPVTGNTPGNVIDIPPDLGFPPTAIQSVGACTTAKPFPISNNGSCPLKINSVAITSDATEFGFSALPSLPTLLQPGHVLGEGNLNAVFAPVNLSRNDDGALTVTYESDPVTHANASVTRNLCGEGVRTGARVLVTIGGVPAAMVEKIHLQRINGNTNKSIVQTVDEAMNLPLQTVIPAIAACAPFQFHREYGTVSNPIQLMPGSYRLTVTAIVNGKRQSQTVAFDTTTCTFNPNIVVAF